MKNSTSGPKKRIVSGMRPTGALHIGHQWGALKNWVDLQNQGHECFYFIADYHALTSNYENPKEIAPSIKEMLRDWIACGLDPHKSVLFLQSHISQVPQLFLLFSMITPLGWLERNPTYKEQRQEIKDKDLSNLGFLSYPVLQTADISLYKGSCVPVGQDQVAHLELSREIVRRFNTLYGQTFPEPQALLTPSPKINGLDARKMSKSYNNAIFLNDSKLEVEKKIQSMVTDPKRQRRSDPGNPDDCNLFPLHLLYSSDQTILQVKDGCTSAQMGCVECKKRLIEPLNDSLFVIQEKRKTLNDSRLDEILVMGCQKASDVAAKTIIEVKEKMGL